MFGFLLNFMNEENNRPKNGTQIMREEIKKYADKCAECEIMIQNEKDPIRKQKMIYRFSLGITDFSDL